MRILLWIASVVVVLLFVWFSTAFPDETIRHYDRNGNRIGFSKREGNRETYYNQKWERQGYSIYEGDRADRFDNRWNRQGSDVYEEPQGEKGEDYEEK